MSEHPSQSGSPRPPASPLRTALAVAAGLAMVASAAAGLGLAAQVGALLFARWIDLGTSADRLAFSTAMTVLGALAGGASGLWLALVLRRGAPPLPKALAGAASVLAVFALGIGHLAFAVTTAPPPVQTLLIAQVRLGGQSWAELAVAAAGPRLEAAAEALRREAQTDGSTLVEVVLPLPEPAGLRAILIRKGGADVARFSLDLPGDPPATANYSQWLTPDRRDGEAATMELRFRIERRVRR